VPRSMFKIMSDPTIDFLFLTSPRMVPHLSIVLVFLVEMTLFWSF
jgi:hypothetical protein